WRSSRRSTRSTPPARRPRRPATKAPTRTRTRPFRGWSARGQRPLFPAELTARGRGPGAISRPSQRPTCGRLAAGQGRPVVLDDVARLVQVDRVAVARVRIDTRVRPVEAIQ